MLAIRRDGPVTVLELQREERRNALDLELCRALAAASQEAVDEGARVIVVTGAGTAFCSGADLGGVYGDEFIEALYGMLHGLTRLPVPVIAAVNGPAIGAGTQLALACDLRVADAVGEVRGAHGPQRHGRRRLDDAHPRGDRRRGSRAAAHARRGDDRPRRRAGVRAGRPARATSRPRWRGPTRSRPSPR